MTRAAGSERARAGFTASRPPADAGFTLVEMMVALFIFALLSAAGVFLLSGSVRAQGAVQAKLDALAGVQRAGALMTVDLAQAVPRISRTQTGTLAPAFFAGGTADGPAVQFVRTGRDNLVDLPRSRLQKLEYALVAGNLVRRAYPQVDGAVADPPAVLVGDVIGAGFRFRALDGSWRGEWRPSDPLALPRAVELTVAPRTGDPIRLVFMVGPDPVPAPTPSASPGPGASPSAVPTGG